MKTLLKIFLLFALAFVITLLVMKWRDRDDEAVDVLSPIEIAEAQAVVERLESEVHRGEVRLDDSTLRRLLIASLADSKSGRLVLENSAGVRASIENGRIEAGVVLSTIGLEEKLEGSGDEKLDRFAAILEWLPGDGVFVGARGVPIAREGKLSLETSTLELLLGPLTFAPEELADKVGLSSERLADDLVLSVEGLSFESARVEEGALILGTGGSQEPQVPKPGLPLDAEVASRFPAGRLASESLTRFRRRRRVGLRWCPDRRRPSSAPTP